jgi:hypothetical protein
VQKGQQYTGYAACGAFQADIGEEGRARLKKKPTAQDWYPAPLVLYRKKR